MAVFWCSTVTHQLFATVVVLFDVTSLVRLVPFSAFFYTGITYEPRNTGEHRRVRSRTATVRIMKYISPSPLTLYERDFYGRVVQQE